MFDTSIVHARAADPKRRFSLLTVSIAIHSAAVLAAVSAGIASVDFPVVAPDQTEIFTPVVAPSPPPLPLGRPAPARPEPTPAKPAPQQAQAAPVAPQVVPDVVPDSAAPVSSPAQSTAIGPGEPSDGPIGDPNGSILGIDIGQKPGGTGSAPAADVTYQPGGDVISARVLRRVEPRYPQVMVNNRVPAIVIVRCIIDKNGRIRNPEIVKGAYGPFNTAVLDAIQQWTFAPGSMHGQAVDTWFELTVNFNVR